MKINITKLELERALKYAEEHGETKFKTICMETVSFGIGTSLKVMSTNGDNPVDITDMESI